jgi:hypothetical protein
VRVACRCEAARDTVVEVADDRVECVRERDVIRVQHRDPRQRMETTMRRTGLLRVGQNGQLVRRAELPEHPQHAL